MKANKRKSILFLIILSITISNFSPIIVQAKALSNNSFAAYSWILLEEEFGSEITINKIQTAKDKDLNENAIIINFTYKKHKKYAYIRLRDGEAKAMEYIPIYQMECDDFPDQHLNLGTFSYKDDLDKLTKIDKTLKIKDVKKLYTKYKKADEYTIIS